MPLRILMRYLANNEQLIQKLAESYPMRRAAQLTSYIFFRGKAIGEDTVDKIQKSEITYRLQNEAKHMGGKIQGEAKQIGGRAQSFQRRLSDEIREGFKEFNEEIKRQQKK